jgi:hypothetical protein
VLLNGAGLDEVEAGLVGRALHLGFFVQNVLGLAHALLANVGVDARYHHGDVALILVAKGAGYFSHGEDNARGWGRRF